MKKILFAALAAIPSAVSLCFAAGEPQPVEEQPPAYPSARILGDISDGTPPSPEPPKPRFNVSAKDVLETKTVEQGGRQITVRKISPIALPPQQEPAAPVNLSAPAVQQRVAGFRAANRNYKMLLVGATVYRLADSPPRSLVSVWPQAQGEPVTVWSSADFALLSGFSSFADSPDSTTRFMMMWSVSNLDSRTPFRAKFANQFKAPEIPEFPAGKATYVTASGNPTPQTLAAIQSLHDLYNNEYDRLKTACEGRERAQRQHEAELKANPPQPKDITLNYWRTEKTAVSEKGVAR
jgi:hypothetical protein